MVTKKKNDWKKKLKAEIKDLLSEDQVLEEYFLGKDPRKHKDYKFYKNGK